MACVVYCNHPVLGRDSHTSSVFFFPSTYMRSHLLRIYLSLQPLPSTLCLGHHPVWPVLPLLDLIPPLYDPAGYMPSIHNLCGMGHCILQKGRQGECGAVESKSIQIGMQCHSATADNASDSDNKVATRRGENMIYKATCILRKSYLTSSRSLCSCP